MEKYSFRFDEVSMNQVWFTAENDEHARELLRQCENEEMNISDLPDAEERNRGIQLDFTSSWILFPDIIKPTTEGTP
jgi:hypothetical protein